MTPDALFVLASFLIRVMSWPASFYRLHHVQDARSVSLASCSVLVLANTLFLTGDLLLGLYKAAAMALLQTLCSLVYLLWVARLRWNAKPR